MEREREREKEREQDKEKRRRTVPKFGSFKPKPTPEPSPETRLASGETHVRAEADHRGGAERRHGHGGRAGERRHEYDRDREREHRRSNRERERHRDWDRESEKQKERERERDKEGDRERGREREKHGKREDHRDRRDRADYEADSALTNDLFAIDKHGDPLIVQYGSNDRSKVPIYRRFGAGRIIGSPGSLTVHRDGPQEQFSIRAPGEGSGSGSAFHDKALVAAVSRRTPRLVRPSSAQPPPPASEDFVALGPSKKRKRGSDDGSDHGKAPDYRSIYGQSRETSASPSSSSLSRSPSPSTSPSQDLPANRQTELSTAKSRSVALTRHLKSTPTDIPAWLDLIALQEPLFRQDHHAGPRTPDESKSLAELKLALYSEALAHAASPRDRERLVLGVMCEGARAWDPGKLARKWDELGNSAEWEGKSLALWRARLDFEMGRVDRFAIGEVRRLITRKLHALAGALLSNEGGNEEGGGREEVCEWVIYVFLRLTRLLFDAGYVELAVAAWQAVLEMVFLRPERAHSAESALKAFAAFWESEVARIGEEGAKGWRQFAEAGDEMAEPPDARRDRPPELPRTTDPFKAWAAVERQTLKKARMPARTLDEGTEDDPFRVVMFSDIEDLLVWFPPEVLPPVKPLLVDAFLVFCGLPPPGLSGERFSALLRDPFVAGKGHGLDLGLTRTEAGPALDLPTRTPEFSQQGGSMVISPELLFSRNTWFRYLDKCSNTYQPRDKQVETSWVLSTLRALIKDCGMEALAEYYLAMEWLNEPAGARKVAKRLLKQYSSSISLYNAYALVEWADQNPEISHKVLSSATGLGLPSSSGDNRLLWNTWAWIHIECGEKEMALARLCFSVDRGFEGSTPSPALLLKARSQFSATRDFSLSSQQLENAARYAESLMLLEYLSAEGGSEPASEAQGNITAALSSVDVFSRELESRNLAKSSRHERLLQAAARLLYHHATHGPYRPIYLRSQLQRFIDLFPQNTIFLSLFTWSQSPLRIDDPVRANLQQAVSLSEPNPGNDSCLSTHRFAIRYEVRVGTAHSVRAAFEASLGDGDACKNSVELWTRYIRFCWASRELRGKAKEVFYRGIAACPWAKEVYMEAFAGIDSPEDGALAGELGVGGLRAVVNTMVSKGLRVHVDLDEFLERWKQQERR